MVETVFPDGTYLSGYIKKDGSVAMTTNLTFPGGDGIAISGLGAYVLLGGGGLVLLKNDLRVTTNCHIQGALSKGSGSCLTTDIFYNSGSIEITRGMVCVSTGNTLGDRTFSKPISSVEPCSIPNDKRVIGAKVVESFSHTIMEREEFYEKAKTNFLIGLKKAKLMEKHLENSSSIDFANQEELNDAQYDLMVKISKTKNGERLHVGILGQYSKVLVDADINPIENGDMLTTSSTMGHGMKSMEMIPGTMFGKALHDRPEGKGYMGVLLFNS